MADRSIALPIADPPPGGGLRYATLTQTHPQYDADYWGQLNALYEGGKALLRDHGLMEKIFPRHRNEVPEVYAERVKRAFYIPYAAEIIDHVVALLTAQPIEMALDGEDEPKWPPFYDDFFKDCSPPGGDRQTFNTLLKKQVLRALLFRRAWTLVDLPDRDPSMFASLADQERAGALSAYAVSIHPSCVVDWEEDEAGELIWALVHTVSSRRAGVEAKRDVITRTWTLYTRDEWKKYRLDLSKDKQPDENTVVPLIARGVHAFGRVPFERLDVPDGLWAMNKLEGLAREHFNKRCALSWAEFQSLFSELYEFLAPETGAAGAPIGEAQQNPSRAFSQPRGQGFVQKLGHQDDARFVGPPSEPFDHAMKSCNNLRDEMHRVTHQMALSVDNSAAALKRSGDSKAQDKAATAVILTALGQLVREHAEAIMNMVARGRQEKDLVGKWAAQGMEKFDAVSLSDMLDGLEKLETAGGIQSATFKRRHQYAVAKALLGDEATDEDFEDIEKELEQNITNESVVPMPEVDLGGSKMQPPGGGAGDDDKEESPPAKKPAPKKPAPGRRTVFSSGGSRR